MSIRIVRGEKPADLPVQAATKYAATGAGFTEATIEVMKTTTFAATPTPVARPLGASGNKLDGIVMSAKTGARARVGVAYAARFQAYIDDPEKNFGARVLFMGGIRGDVRLKANIRAEKR